MRSYKFLPLSMKPFGTQGGVTFFTWVLGGAANHFLRLFLRRTIFYVQFKGGRRFLTTFSSIWPQSYVITIAPSLTSLLKQKFTFLPRPNWIVLIFPECPDIPIYQHNLILLYDDISLYYDITPEFDRYHYLPPPKFTLTESQNPPFLCTSADMRILPLGSSSTISQTEMVPHQTVAR